MDLTNVKTAFGEKKTPAAKKTQDPGLIQAIQQNIFRYLKANIMVPSPKKTIPNPQSPEANVEGPLCVLFIKEFN